MTGKRWAAPGSGPNGIAGVLVAIVVLMSLTACRAQSRQSPADNATAKTPQTQLSPEGAAGMRQFPDDRAPRRDVDWSLLKKDPASSRLGNWDEVVGADKVCLSLSDSDRCNLLRRAAKKAASESEIRDVMGQVNAALPILERVWADEFSLAGRTFVAPTVFYYGIDPQLIPGVFSLGAVAQRAGDCLKPFDNSLYCPATHTIYLDAVYLARIAAAVRATDGTSGRFAAIAVAAHELGHAVDAQVGLSGGQDYDGKGYVEELLGDCLAGVAVAALRRAETGTGSSQAARLLKTSDALVEGQLGISLIGGPTSLDGAHEAGPVRADFFTGGFNLGISSCINRARAAVK